MKTKLISKNSIQRFQHSGTIRIKKTPLQKRLEIIREAKRVEQIAKQMKLVKKNPNLDLLNFASLAMGPITQSAQIMRDTYDNIKDSKINSLATNAVNRKINSLINDYGQDSKGNVYFRSGTNKWVPLNSSKSNNKSSNKPNNKSNNKSNNLSSSTTKSSKITPINLSDNNGHFWTGYSGRQSELNGKSVRDMQNELNKYFANDKDYVALKTDNIWGDKTEAAYQRYLSENNTNNQTNNVQQTNTHNTPNTPSTTYTITEPYTLKYNYNNSLRDISKLGFNNYVGLVNFAKNSEHPLAQDLRYVFGDPEKWNQNEVESALRISGHYGRGFLGNGDFSDIIRNIQNLYAIKRNDQEIKQVAPDNINPYKSFDFVGNFNNWARDFNSKYNFNRFTPVEQLPDVTFAKYKQGGNLISKNPVERFKKKN